MGPTGNHFSPAILLCEVQRVYCAEFWQKAVDELLKAAGNELAVFPVRLSFKNKVIST